MNSSLNDLHFIMDHLIAYNAGIAVNRCSLKEALEANSAEEML